MTPIKNTTDKKDRKDIRLLQDELAHLYLECNLLGNQKLPSEYISEKIYDKGRLIAYAGIVKRRGFIPTLNLMVSPEYQNRGIGTKIATNLLKRWKLPICLTVDNDNTNAIKIYKRLGFRKIFNLKKIKRRSLFIKL